MLWPRAPGETLEEWQAGRARLLAFQATVLLEGVYQRVICRLVGLPLSFWNSMELLR